MKRISEKCQLSFNAISNKPHITKACGQWVCYWSGGDLNLCIKAEQFSREINRKRYKNYTAIVIL